MRSVVFRTDASTTIGSGHVMRCLTLASALRERGAAVLFVCRACDGNLCSLIEERGYEVRRLPLRNEGTRADGEPAPAALLEAAWKEDAELTYAAIKAASASPDWLVADHYYLDRRWEGALRTSVGQIMVIDDLADRPHDCDLLLDQNLVAHLHSRYANKVPAACGLLLGPEYALLQPIYAELHDRTPLREGPVRSILISFGGAGNNDLTRHTLAAFLRLKRPDIDVDVVIAASSPRAAEIRQQVAEHSNIRLHSCLPTLAPLMAKADFAIGGGGATTWERLCLGLPSLVVTMAENQRPIADELSQRGLVRWLGHRDAVDELALSEALSGVIQLGLNEDWSRRCSATVDGKGVNRVCAVLTATATTPLRVRHATQKDEALLLRWTNDPTSRANAILPGPVSEATHRSWLSDRLRNVEGCRLYIIETTDGVALGQVRFERHDQEWEVHYALAPVFRGRGLGRHLLEVALLELGAGMRSASIIGRVKDGNYLSRRVFESLGFAVRPNSGEGVVVYQRAL